MSRIPSAVLALLPVGMLVLGAGQAVRQTEIDSLRAHEVERCRDYPWVEPTDSFDTLAERFPPPQGFRRVAVGPGEFGPWLRHLPMKPRGTPVHSYAREVVVDSSEPHLAGVVDLDLIGGDVQQCADVIIRLRAEYLWSTGNVEKISFRFTSGDLCRWTDWASGTRPVVEGNRVSWTKSARADTSRGSFLRYLEQVFYYAGTISLSYDSVPVQADSIAIGDFFLDSGSPGHAVIVLDLAVDADGAKRMLLGQSYMPAQDLHVLRARVGDPWFDVDLSREGLDTPAWRTLPWSSLRRFR